MPATAPCSSAPTAMEAPAMKPGAARPMPKPWIIMAAVSSQRVSVSAIITKARISSGMARRSSVKGAKFMRCTTTAWEKSEWPPPASWRGRTAGPWRGVDRFERVLEAETHGLLHERMAHEHEHPDDHEGQDAGSVKRMRAAARLPTSRAARFRQEAPDHERVEEHQSGHEPQRREQETTARPARRVRGWSRGCPPRPLRPCPGRGSLRSVMSAM
jgi:hypothetical protein